MKTGWKLGASALFALAVASGSPATVAKTQEQKLGVIVSGFKQPKRITIIKSMSCVFCRILDKEIFPKDAIALQKRGYEIEVILVTAQPSDRITTAVVRCGKASGFTSRMRRLYNSTSIYTGNDLKMLEQAAISRAADYNLSDQEIRKCLSPTTYKKNDDITRQTKERFKYTGTPSIYLNGKFIGHTAKDIRGL